MSNRQEQAVEVGAVAISFAITVGAFWVIDTWEGVADVIGHAIAMVGFLFFLVAFKVALEEGARRERERRNRR